MMSREILFFLYDSATATEKWQMVKDISDSEIHGIVNFFFFFSFFYSDL